MVWGWGGGGGKGGRVKMSSTMSWLGDEEKYKWFKYSEFLFFLNIVSVSGIQLFYIRSYVLVDIIRGFFNFLIF